jgi:16S rRNA (guanine527-N7)-methyltransferase
VSQSLADGLRDGLGDGLTALGLALSADQQNALLAYLALLQKWNQVYNLTAVREPQAMLTHHLLDSLAVVAPLQAQMHTLASAAPLRLLDVGSGAGLPGVVLAICLPDLQVDCVDTVAKKASFIQQVALSLGLPNLRGLHARVERIEPGYQLVSARAFSSLPDLVQGSDAALVPGGIWMAMKGKTPTEEMQALPPSVQVFHVEPLTVPGLDAQRCIVWMHRAAA